MIARVIIGRTGDGSASGSWPDGRRAGAVDGGPSVGVVIPFHGRPELLARCVASLGRLEPPPADVVVVNDGDPAGLELARPPGVRLLELTTRHGPAAARNHGVASLSTDIVLFIDADVVVPPDTVAKVRRAFVGRPDVAAIFGSYDDRPVADGLVSRYKNLLHHWTHQHASGDASTFWTGCGAIRRPVFVEVGGFDPSQRWLEDVELGYRLRAAGHRIRLDRDLRVSHLKHWSLGGLLISDIAHRAVPWTELACRYRALPNDLNTDLVGRVSGALALAAVLLLLGALALPWLALVAAAAALGIAWLNRSLYRFFWRCGGLRLLVAGTALHWLYLVYGAAVFTAGSMWWRAVGARRPIPCSPLAVDPPGADAQEPRIQALAAGEDGSELSRPSARRRSA